MMTLKKLVNKGCDKTLLCRFYILLMFISLNGCVVNPYGGGVSFGMPSFSDLLHAATTPEKKEERVSVDYITLSNEEIYQSQNNLGNVFILFKGGVELSKETKIYFVYSLPSKMSKIVIVADALSLDGETVELPIPNYPSRDARYKDFILEYMGVYMSKTHNIIYVDHSSDYFSSGKLCHSKENIDKFLYSPTSGNKSVAIIRFDLNNENEYSCDFMCTEKISLYRKDPALDLGL